MTTQNNAENPYLAEQFTKDLASAKTVTFENILLRTFVKKIWSYFGLKSAFFAPRTDYWPMLGRIVQNNQQLQQENKVNFPIAFITPTMLEDDPDRYDSAKMRRNKIHGKVTDTSGKQTVRAHTLLPTIFRFDVTVYTDSFSEWLHIANRWRFSLKNSPDLHFTVNFDGIEVDVTVRPDTALAVPKKEQELTQPNFYETIMAFEVRGFMSDLEGVNMGAFITPILEELTVEFLFGNVGDPDAVVGFTQEIKE